MGYPATIPIYRDSVRAWGHQAIRAMHPTTFELTKDSYVTERGDCIIGVNLDKSVAELDVELRRALKKNTSIVLLILRVGDVVDTVLAQGSDSLILTDERKVVIRRSSYVDAATLAINANKSARSLRRDLIEKLRDPRTTLVMDIYVLDLGNVVRL